MTEESRKFPPVYKSLKKHVNMEQGFAVWLPGDWRKINLADDRIGWIFSPYQDHFDTCFMVEKIILEYSSTPEDADVLVEGFEAGIRSLPEVEVETISHRVGKKSVAIEARYTFSENGERRKRWVKSLYWGEANLMLLAQGATPEDYAYWESMLYSCMTTYELGIA